MNIVPSIFKRMRSVMLLLVTMLTLSAQTARAQGTWDKVTLVASPAEGGILMFDNTPGNETHLYVCPNENYYLKSVTLSAEGSSILLSPAVIPTDAEDQEPYYVISDLNKECTVTARFYTWTSDVRVTFDNNGHGTAPAPDYQDLQLGNKVTRPTPDPTADNYIFCGWYKDKDGIEAYDFNAELSKSNLKYSQNSDRYNLKLYALWANANCTVSFDANGGTGDAMAAVTQAGNTTYTIPECTFTKTSYVFYGWSIDNNGSAIYFPGDEIMMANDMTLYAVWKQISGKCGINWAVSKSAGSNKYDVLTLSGSGKMTQMGDARYYPWYECRDLLTTIVIEDGVTSIEHNAFKDYDGITTLSIGNGVQTIGNKAFNGLSSLTSLVIGNGIQIIGQSAFEALSNLTSDIIIPASVSTIGKTAFSRVAVNTANGISITAADGSQLTSIGPQAFSGGANATIDLSKCTQLETIGESQTFTGSKDVILPSSINSIAQYAFGRHSIFSGDHAYITVPAGKVLSVGSDKGVIADNGKADLIRFLFNNPASRGISNALTLAMNNLSDWEGQTRSVTLERTFPAGKKQTVCLPFNPSELLSLGKVWEFTGISGGKAIMTQVTSGTLSANTPYIFEATSDVTSITFNNVAINIGTEPKTVNGTAGFTFHGTYEQKVWEASSDEVQNGTIYGFMMSDNDGQAAGQFVKARRRTVLRPFSCWLEYNGNLSGTQTSQAPLRSATGSDASSATSELPDVIEIMWVNADGTTETTGIIDTPTGTLYDDDAWYDLFGRKLNGEPTKPGLYINNGKKVHM